MNKSQAAQILNLEVTADATQVTRRYRQTCAFLDGDSSASDSLAQLINSAKLKLDDAFGFFETVEVTQKEGETSVVDEKKEGAKDASSTSILFPYPKELAGEPFPEQWWKVYKRAVLLGCGVSALVLWQLPKVLHSLPSPKPQPQPYVEPYTPSTQTPQTNSQTDSQTNSGSPFGTVGAPPGSTESGETTKTTTGTSTWPPPGIDTSLNPTPNSNPLVIAPTQTPTAFLVGLFWAIKQSGNTASMIKQPPTARVATLLMTNFSRTPRLDQLPQDAMQVLNQTDGAATVRVNEVYFTGIQSVDDYYLVSDNGVWKVVDLQPVSGGFR